MRQFPPKGSWMIHDDGYWYIGSGRWSEDPRDAVWFGTQDDAAEAMMGLPGHPAGHPETRQWN